MENDSPIKITGGFNRREPFAISWVYREYHARVWGIIAGLVGAGCPDLDDLVSEVFVSLLDSDGHFDRMAKIRSFLFNAAHHNALAYLRRKGIVQQGVQIATARYGDEEEWPLAENFTQEELVSRVFEVMKMLPPEYNRLLTLTYEEGLNNGQIAAKLGMVKKTVANKKVIALKMLKDILKEAGLLTLFNLLI